MNILIDNGHGLDTPGKRSPIFPTVGQLIEWQYTRDIASKLEIKLREDGIPAKRIVTEHRDIPLWERVIRVNKVAMKYGPENCLLVSIHVNASMDGKARGWEIFTNFGNSKSDEYATIFWEEAKKRLKGITPMRQDLSDGDPDRENAFTVLRGTLCPALLTENLFMDQEDDCRFLLSERGKETMVEIHHAAIRKICSWKPLKKN